MALKDMSGQRFGRLKVVSHAGTRTEASGKKRSLWLCNCDCGNTVEVLRDNLVGGRTTSCGCYRYERSIACNTDHGGTGTRLFDIWQSMKERCYNPNCKSYANYGGRGISIWGEWRKSFQKFRFWALRNGYKDNLTIDRIDNDGPYAPWNCRWVTMQEQQYNRRNNRYIEYGGERMTLTEWAIRLNMKPNTLHQRFRYGWSVDRALTEPLNGLKARKKA